ncbi:SMP-30/gluconolactonase/LRE family protein [Roseateles cellulosilyticus]|uniref:SMP-30/gluconolactonase/LRE family protein n=1 Tax=Pelomonas cellulosilytica TaxID=2906762 RepID=A0ABS8XRS3_9BURK|nr:SMP-30/gluconolactonase/LRE family protein [Pelomonas sp. P8]MCE4553990.1 SMP-30/gluconolactonase/LRE family protein [Pelomonas sp. P8]
MKPIALSVALALSGGAHAALKPGDAAPDFKASAAFAGKTIDVQLKDALAKGPVVVYFYPAAFTGGCNLQAHEFAENVARFTAAGATVIGVSGDGIERLREFSTDPETCAGRLTVASDAAGQIARGFDIATTATPPGRKTTRGQEITHARAERTTFVIGRDGRIVATVGGVSPVENVNAVLAAVQQLAPEPTRARGVPGVVADGTPIVVLGDGFKGTEGPVGLPDGSLLFTETQDARITRIASDGHLSTHLLNTNGANGLGFSPTGELVAVQVNDTRVGTLGDAAKTLASDWGGKPFGRPNDLVVARDGTIYFTDSGRNANQAAPVGTAEPAPPAVYRLKAGRLDRIATDITRPNGIQLSPDEKTLYVADTAGDSVLAYALQADGSLGPRRNFVRLAGYRQAQNGSWSSGADGLAIDAQGRLYVATNVGVEVFDAAGQALGVISLPKQPQNLAFAGVDKKQLFIVGRGAAWRIDTLAQGYTGRAK